MKTLGKKTKEDTTMKKNIFNIKTLAALLMAGAAFTACSNEDDFIKEQPVNPTQKYIMTVNATKGDGTTRALSLSSKTLSAKWVNTDQVFVFPEAWSSTTTLTPIGTLTAAASATGSTSLAGEVETTNLNTGDNVQMLFPRATWDYTGQKGVLLAEDDADNAIEKKYDYALATPSITVSGTNEITANAAFESQQAIVKFNLQNAGGTPISVSSLNISAASGKLVQSRDMKPTYSPEGYEDISGLSGYYLYVETNAPIAGGFIDYGNYDLDNTYGSDGCKVISGAYVYRYKYSQGGTPSSINMIMIHDGKNYLINFSGSITFTNGMYLRQDVTDYTKVDEIPVVPGDPVIGSNYGNLTVTPTSPTSELTVALRNELDAADTYMLTASDGVNSYYLLKSGVDFQNGNYYEITVKMQDASNLVNLSTLDANTVITNGQVVTGQLANNVKLTIADGATVTLNNVTINGVNDNSYGWAGITCEGDATIILKGTNTVKGFYEDYPGIQAATGKTLTIQGTGSLNASSNGSAPGIGANDMGSCGNIIIAGGTITATGGIFSAGIGGARYATCGNITISGGIVNATGGGDGAGIGSGYNNTKFGAANCGAITISGGTVTARGGDGAAGIGVGSEYGSSSNPNANHCGAITISGGNVTAISGNSAAAIGKSNDGTCPSVTFTTGITSLTLTNNNGTEIVSDFLNATAVQANALDITGYLGTAMSSPTVTAGMTTAGFTSSYDSITKTWTVTKN